MNVNSDDQPKFNDFYVKQIGTSCLAQFSYYLESGNEAIIIDPMRDIELYQNILKERKTSLKYIFETHFHADFVSGHLELFKKTGAQIVYGPNADPDFEFIQAEDEQIFSIGKIKLKVLHTPGHTLESCCFVILDSKDESKCVFTGDTLFLGEVGRPDLAAKKTSMISEQDLAGMLYDSIHQRIKPLDDSCIVFPGHGAGSACGKKISSGGWDTLSHQKITNYVFNQNLKKLEFIEIATSNLNTPPQYFFHDVMLNKKGPEEIQNILKKSFTPLTVDQLKKLLESENETIILDTRDVEDFCKGHIPNSISITLKTNYATWTGTLFGPLQKIVLVTDKDKEVESIIRLARVGYENVIGFLENGIESWLTSGNKVSSLGSIDANDFISNVLNNNELSSSMKIVDVREKGEYESTGVIEGSILLPLSKLNCKLTNFLKNNDEEKEVYLLCRSGQRTLIAASILKMHGIKNKMINIRGGVTKLLEQGLKLNKYSENI